MGTIGFGVHGYETVGESDQIVLAAVVNAKPRGYMVFNRRLGIAEGSNNPEDDIYSSLPPDAYIVRDRTLFSQWLLFVRPEFDVAMAYPALMIRGTVFMQAKGIYSSRKQVLARFERGGPFELVDRPATIQDMRCNCGCHEK